MNRREFLATGSVTIASLALASVATIELRSAAGSGTPLAASKLCLASFAQCVDSAFQLHHTALGTLDLKLSNLLDRKPGDGSEQFTLIFHAPKNTELIGGTFVMAHASTGLFPVYIESAGEDEKGSLFRADFNLTRS